MQQIEKYFAQHYWLWQHANIDSIKKYLSQFSLREFGFIKDDDFLTSIWINYKESRTLCYYSRNYSTHFQLDWCDVYIFRNTKKHKQRFDNKQEIIQNINCFLRYDENLYTKVIEHTDYNEYNIRSVLGRIVRYFYRNIFTQNQYTNDIKSSQYTSEIVIWEQWNQCKRDTNLWIQDYYFSPKSCTSGWKPTYTENDKIQKLIKEVDIMKTLTEAFFGSRKQIQLFKDYSFYMSYIDSRWSAKIEWYEADKLTDDELYKILKWKMYKYQSKHSIQAINNIKDLEDKIDDIIKDDFSLSVIQNIQKNIVKNTAKQDENIDDKTPWHFRNFDICVVDQRYQPHDPKHIVFIAPKAQHTPSLMHELWDYLASILKDWNNDNIHPVILASIISTYFVQIHPFWDGNGRTSRYLFMYILKKMWWLQEMYHLPLSYTIHKKKTKYYWALQENWKNIHSKTSYDINWLSNSYIAKYKDVNVYRNNDFTSIVIYFLETVKKSFFDSITEYMLFTYRQEILASVTKKLGKPLNENQQHRLRLIIKRQFDAFNWWPKSSAKLQNDFDTDTIQHIKETIMSYEDKVKDMEIIIKDWNIIESLQKIV